MPGLKTHSIQSAISTAAIYPFAGFENAVVFGCSIVMIDIDHVIEYVRQTGSPRIWGVFPCCHIIDNNLDRGFYVFNIFHTIEFLLFIGMLGLLDPVFFYAFAGALWHCALDLLMLAKRKHTIKRALSIIEYCIRARNPDTVVRLRDLLGMNAVTIPKGPWDYQAWIQHWQHCTPLC